MNNSAEKQVVELLKRSNKILILPSSPPDGDSVGSAIALYMVLKKLGKQAVIVCNDSIPELLQFLPKIKAIENKILSGSDFIISIDSKNVEIADIKTVRENGKVNFVITPKNGRISESDIHFTEGEIDYDLIVTVDTAELKQLRDFYEQNVEIFHQVPVVNIDHHISNAHFGKVNYVDIMASSTTELLLPLFETLAKEESMDLIDEDIATLLLTGIITDTGSFQNANTTPKAFARAAQLIAYGARQQEIIQHIYKTKQLSQLKLWGRVLSKIQVDEKFRLVWSVVSQQDFLDTGSTEDQTGDIIDELMTNAPGAEIVLLIKEKKDSIVSISVRTTSDNIDASRIAESFGGGGHVRAAGFTVKDMSLRDAEYAVISSVRDFQTERLGMVDEKEIKEIIDVPELMHRAEEAEKATEIMAQVTPIPTPTPTPTSKPKSKVEKPSKTFKPKIPTAEKEPKAAPSVYRFED